MPAFRYRHRLRQRVTLSGRSSPHVLRYTFAVSFLRNGGEEAGARRDSNYCRRHEPRSGGERAVQLLGEAFGWWAVLVGKAGRVMAFFVPRQAAA